MLLSGEALRLITGLDNVTAREMDSHSQAMIDGIANYGGDPAVESRCVEAVATLDAAIEAKLAERQQALATARQGADAATAQWTARRAEILANGGRVN